MENKQTAVEWLEEKVDNMILNGGDTDLLAVIEHINQAKAMEKEQMQNFYIEGRDFAQYNHDEQFGGIEYWDREPMGFKQYYNGTYGK